MKEFADRLRHLLSIRHMTQGQMAELLGITQGTMSAYINAKKTPNLRDVVNYARALGVSAGWLLGEGAISKYDTDNPEYPMVAIGSSDSGLRLPSAKELADNDYKLQQIALAFQNYKDPQHRVNLLEKALSATNDDFKCRIIMGIYAAVMDPQQCDTLYKTAMQQVMDEF